MPNVALKATRSILMLVLIAGFGTAAAGEGVTYPDGTVSPYPPAFYGIGHAEPYKFSEATGVAAIDGVVMGVVGIVNGGPLGFPSYEAVFSGGGGLLILSTEGAVSAEAFGVSADGKIKVGEMAGHPVFWGSNLQHTKLQLSQGYVRGTVLAITPSGSQGVGYSETGAGQDAVTQATRWPIDGSASPTLLGFLDGYDSSLAKAVSPDGQVICGHASNSGTAQINGASVNQRAFLKEFTSPMIELAPLPGDTDSNAHALFVGGSLTIVYGQSWNRNTGSSSAVTWHKFKDFLDVPRPLKGIAGPNPVAAVYASGGRAVGMAGPALGDTQAVRWDDNNNPETIAAVLLNQYKVPVGKWRLLRATGASGNTRGQTICGVGIDPEGNNQGWVAVLPPIYHPPIVVQPPNFLPDPGEIFSYQVEGTNDPLYFGAKGLPPGFSMDSKGTITGLWSADQIEKIGVYTVTVAVGNNEGTGTASFSIGLLPPLDSSGTAPKNEKKLQGHTFLPYNKAPGETYFPTSFGLGLSGNGQVAVGYSGPNNDPRAYHWTPSSGMTELPALEGALYPVTRAEATSADGQTIVGQGVTAPNDEGTAYNVAVKWNLGATATARMAAEAPHAPSATITSLGFIPPNGTSSTANAVSADGTVIVGHGSDYNPEIKGTGNQQAFRWSAADGMVGLGWLPGSPVPHSSTATAVSDDGSVVVGGSNSGNGSQAFRWTAAEGMIGMGILPGASFSRATGISGDKSTIIGHNGFSNHNRAFRWTASTGMQEVGALPGDNVSEANAVSFDGSIIVGKSTIDFNPSRAFIWDQTNGMRDLKSVLVAANPALTNWSLRTAESISADGGTVVGYGINPTGDLEGFTAFLEIKPRQLLNIATRMRVLTGDKVLIGGFIITGTDPKKVIIRGIGPSLKSVGVQDALADPGLELRQGDNIIASNDDWKENQPEVEATAIPPGDDLESAIVTTLAPGSYTAILSGKDGGTGVGVVELYDLGQGGNSRLANISSRGFVATGDNVMIGGLIVGGGSPVGTGRVLIRAIGPSLAEAGVSGVLEDPTLELFNASGTSLAVNNDWQTSQKAEIEATTIPPADAREAAILATLPGGNYTAVVRGNNNTSGVAVVEAYNLQ